MRDPVLAAIRAAFLFLTLAASAAAYEVEEERYFGPEGGREISVLSTTDLDSIAPVLEDYIASHPNQRIRYEQAASVEVFRAIHEERVPFDLVMSSAMDLQMKLANDGFAASISPETGALPSWARWRDQLYGVGLEPVVTLASRQGLGDLPVPRTRRDLIAMLREHPERFDGRIASYDPQESGVGYFLISQDSRQSEGFWRLAEVMGRLNARLFCCSGEMIDELRAGRVAIAYNVVASYAARFAPEDPDIVRVALEDYTLAIVRSALVPTNAPNSQDATDLLSYLLSEPAQRKIAASANVALIPETGPKPSIHLRPIRLDTGLLVYDDQLRRAGLLAEWNAAMVQP
ncbi:ABC transporter substrate-binding protein [Paracoccus saliphilus]|uniref:ABC transporter substrate-binding protein n=1 Tax=Paracoccus saliphilus TaxID=405559 RepID=A0AA45W333_9RHOB|nr:substrate-binding domain-containing protein [Paracoccus saliphilus]WCR04936.1 ABC transporter substrate-binding protein [Paracoccus saliphilus]SIS72350.1 iron(III) transport system substrate-binding protein [Paracoccus saliphilus]